jgi:hypothetical protein
LPEESVPILVKRCANDAKKAGQVVVDSEQAIIDNLALVVPEGTPHELQGPGVHSPMGEGVYLQAASPRRAAEKDACLG